ncbi:EthD family reductase [Pseudooceanicola aestuarii]|uniref:EthD family reductase n=1 Tax=Pseudooceanicola aestuarii TaxID=2697319 RepID=UPI0013D4FB74|nr:EthD family reductase [Pseudooceanicola aestuarii]
MPHTLQVAYPKTADTTFDMTYYLDRHMALVRDTWGAGVAGVAVSADAGLDPQAPFHVIVTMEFTDRAALDTALGNSAPLMGDIANFYTGARAQVLIGEKLL